MCVFSRRRCRLQTKIHNPVCGFDDVQVMFDNHNRVAPDRATDAALQATAEYRQSAGRWWVSSRIYSVWPVPRFDSSRASFTRCASPPDSVVTELPQTNVGQPYVHQRLQLTRQCRYRIKELTCFFNGHIQHFVDCFAFVFDLKGFAVMALH